MTVGTMTIMTCGMPVLPPPAPGPVPATVQVRSSSSGGIGRQCRGGSALTVRTVGPPGTVAQAAGPWQSQSVTVTVTVPWRPAGGLLRPGPGLLDRAATAPGPRYYNATARPGHRHRRTGSNHAGNSYCRSDCGLSVTD